MKTKRIGFLALAILGISFSAEARTTIGKIELADRIVEPVIDEPKGEGPHPILVLVMDGGDATRDPLLESLAASANKDGYVTVRLDWTYKKKKGAASADLKLEAEELGFVVSDMLGSRMMKQFEVDTSKVAMIAKGFGARVAMMPASGGTSDKVKATLLLNPGCDEAEGSFAKTYAPFLAAKTPRMIITPRAVANCPIQQIYASAKDFSDTLSLYAFDKDTVKSDAASAASLHWLKNLGWSMAAKASTKKPDAKKHSHDAQAAGTHP